MKLKGTQLATFLLILTLGTGAQKTPAGPVLSVTGSPLEFHRVADQPGESDNQPTLTTPLDDFIATVANGNAFQVVGVYAPDLFSMSVLQQPASNPGFVSSQMGVATQFSMASQYGTTGLLAHNTSSGFLFYSLSEGQPLTLVYGDGTVHTFRVVDVGHYQALSPNSAYSDFVDLDNGGSRISATQLFNRIYSGGNRLVLQTCLAKDGNPSWGRLFVTAVPFEFVQKSPFIPMFSK